MKRIFAVVLVISLFIASGLAETAIDPYVIKADVAAYLSEEDILLFQKLMDGVLVRAERVELSRDYDANLRAFSALMGSPYYFFVEKLSFTPDHRAVTLRYAYTAQEQSEMRAFMDGEMGALLDDIRAREMNELEQVLAVYKYFGQRIEYDYDWLGALNMADDKFLFPEIEIYQALKTNRGVCHSYTYLCELALRQLGIECLRLSGEMVDQDDGHMWLAVQIGDAYYHADPTWDDNGERVGLSYFGMTDAERRASGCVNYEMSYDGAYGIIVCESEAFAAFRGVVNFSFIEGAPHRILLDYGGETAVFNTQTFEVEVK